MIDDDDDVSFDGDDDDDDDWTILVTPFQDYPTPYDTSLNVDIAMDWKVNAIPK